MQTNFLHCFYCVGVTVSPYLMSLALSDNMNWRGGYKTAFFVQSAIAVLAVMSLPIWKKVKQTQPQEEHIQILSLSQMLKRKKIWASCGVFIGISALESTCLIWGGTFLSESVRMPADTASTLITFYFIGMALSRLLSGVLTIKYSDWQIIFSGQAVIFMAVILLLIQNSVMAATLGLFLIGLGNGPIFPNTTHLTPGLYSKEPERICGEAVCSFRLLCYRKLLCYANGREI